MLVIAILAALAFAVSNGFHDSSNAVAALVATRAARPGQAVVLAGVLHVVGPLVAGAAVADTVGGIITVGPGATVAVVGAAVTAALAWNVVTWLRGLPSSSSHALVGGLVGAGLLQAGLGSVRWGGLAGARPTGVFGVLIVLAASPLLGFGGGFLISRVAHRALRRARRTVAGAILRAEWGTAGLLAFSHGANDAAKTMGLVTLLLVAGGHLQRFAVPLWVTLVCAGAMTLGTSLGGWRIVRTVGRGIYRIRPLDGLVSQGASAGVIFAAALLGGPASTTHVVASSVMGVGAGQRWQHVRWHVAREIALAWVVTIPASAALAAALLPLWRWAA